MYCKSIIFSIVLICFAKSRSSDMVEGERLLDINLKVLRTDFNKLIENVENLATDFIKQIEDAGDLIETANMNGEDYNWQDDKNLKKKPISTSAESTTSVKPPKSTQYSGFYTLPEKYLEQQELTNEIQKRSKRSLEQLPTNNGKQASLNSPIQSGQRPTGPFRNEQMLPTSYTEPKTRDQEERPGTVLGSQQNIKEQQPNTNTNNNNPICTSKTQKDIDMEQQKLYELKREVKKLNELVSLLKDQQKVMNSLNQADTGLVNNEIDTDLQKGVIENSFLYKTLKQLEENRKAERSKKDFENIQDKALNTNLDLHDQGIDKLKEELKKTVQNLNETREILMKEKEKENILESELKRQQTEMKFLKVMMENLYDKNNIFTALHGQAKVSSDAKNVRNSALDGNDIDSLLGAAHTPKPLPARIINIETKDSENVDDGNISDIQKFLKSLTPSPSETISLNMKSERRPTNEHWDPKTPMEKENNLENQTKKLVDVGREDDNRLKKGGAADPEEAFRKQLLELFAKVHEKYESTYNPYKTFNEKYETEFLANQTKSALIQMTKGNTDLLKKFGLNTRASDSLDNQQNKNMYRLISILSKQKNDAINSEINDINQDNIKNEKLVYLNGGVRDNRTFLSNTARASGGSKGDDLEFKLKLIEMLTNKEKKDDPDDKEKRLEDAIKNVIQPEKKSDSEVAVEALKTLIKEQQRPQKKTEDSLNKLLKSLNAKPQSKTDDSDIENELRQLQRAINNLRPKEDNEFNNFDVLNSGKGKDDAQNFQSMLNQIITQNGASPSNGLGGLEAQSSFNTAGADTNSLAAQQVLSQLMSGQISGIQDFGSSQYVNNQPIISAPPYYNPNAYSYSSRPNIYVPSPGYVLPSPKGYGSNFNNPYYGANLYGSYINAYSSNHPNSYSYSIPSPYQANSNSYNDAYNSGHINYYLGGNSGYGTPPTSPGLYSNIKYQPNNYPNGNVHDTSYALNYQPSKINYPSPSYEASGYLPAVNGYYNSGKAGQGGAFAQSYSSGGNGYYGSGATTNLLDYGKTRFQTSSGIGGSYPGYNYGSKSYAEPSLEQPYSYGQISNQQKYGVISDLNQQIQNLENVITGLNKGKDYYQTADDKASVAALEQRIYELKGVINSLNPSSYSQTFYGPPQQPHRTSTQPAPYGPTQQAYAASAAASYNSRPQLPSLSDDVQYQTNAADGPGYTSSQPTGYTAPQSSASPTYQQPEYSSNPAVTQPNQAVNSSPPASYQPNPLETPSHSVPAYQSYSVPPNDNAATYQPKVSDVDEDRRMSSNNKNQKHRRTRSKRQIERGLAPPMTQFQEAVNSRYDLGNDAFIQIANIFKKYLEENITQSNEQPTTDSARQSVLNGLQQKLDTLKLQLESQKPSARSLNDLLAPTRIYNPTVPPYSYQNSYPTGLSVTKGSHIEKINNKKTDILTEIIVKILEKAFRALPEVVGRLFGNLVTDIGDSYGDSYSPLQTVLGNLGQAGYLPLVLIRIIETVGTIFKYLKKNQFFKQFLIPGLVLGLVGGAILFLIYFFQQDEPYGYIGYQGNGYNSYPYYESNYDRNQYYSGTDYRNKKEKTYYRSNNNIPIDSNLYGAPFFYNEDIRKETIPMYNDRFMDRNRAYFNNGPLHYSRGYYDYFRDSWPKNINANDS